MCYSGVAGMVVVSSFFRWLDMTGVGVFASPPPLVVLPLVPVPVAEVELLLSHHLRPPLLLRRC